MFPCCVGSGYQWLNEDKTINNPALDKAKFEHRQFMQRSTKFAKMSESQVNAQVEAIGKCRCECHVINSSVMH